jgi:effector-binding domain-containing protein
VLRDFKQWPAWSPWVITEPDCELSYSDDGKSYSWRGKIIGSGEMAIVEEDAPRRLDCALTILMPWKSMSDVHFTFSAKGGGTEVTWTMNGSLPFVMFWMKKMMIAYIGMDYDRGLSMLKDYVETGSVPSKLEFEGEVEFPGFHYIGVRNKCPIPELSPRMKADMSKVCPWVESASVKPSGPPFAMYHVWDAVKGEVEYTVGAQFAEKPGNFPAELISGEQPAGKVYRIKHTGPYRHLSNPWSSGMMHYRAKVFKLDTKLPSFEVYEGDPEETPENDLVTVVNMPVKA